MTRHSSPQTVTPLDMEQSLARHATNSEQSLKSMKYGTNVMIVCINDTETETILMFGHLKRQPHWNGDGV
jgi:hypothetical protein